MSIIDFSEEQSMLLETANEFCRENSTISVVRAQIDKEESVDAELWSRIVELGAGSCSHPWKLMVCLTRPTASSHRGKHGQVLDGITLYFLQIPTAEAILSCASRSKNPVAAQNNRGSPTECDSFLTEEDGNWRLEEISSRAEKDGKNLALTEASAFVMDGPMLPRSLASSRLYMRENPVSYS